MDIEGTKGDRRKQYDDLLKEFDFRHIDGFCVCKCKFDMTNYVEWFLSVVNYERKKSFESIKDPELRDIQKDLMYLLFELKEYYIKYDANGYQILQ